MNAVELTGMAERLHPEWGREFLLDPAKFRPGIVMPSFWPEGPSSHPGVLDGDTDRQLAAIWRYLIEGDRLPEGYPPVDRREFELIPEDRVVVQRGFISPAGTHAVAVGFPSDKDSDEGTGKPNPREDGQVSPELRSLSFPHANAHPVGEREC